MTFDEAMALHGPALKRVAASYAAPGAARDDLEQEIALAIHLALPRFRGQAALRTYLYRIAHNCGVDASTRQRTRQQREPTGLDLGRVDSAADPESQLLARERYEQLAAALRRLPLSQRQAMVLRLEGLRYSEIAEVLDLSVEAVGLRVHRAKRALTAQLNPPTVPRGARR